MPNYQNGKIYTIRSRSRAELIYVGSTTQSLAVRMGKHKRMKDGCSSSQIIAIGDAYIELVEIFPCDTKDELHKKENEVMRSMDCVNKKSAQGRDMENNKQWVDEYKNKPEVKDRMKEWYKEYKNKPDVIENRKIYMTTYTRSEEQKQNYRDKQKEYKNKPEVKERLKEWHKEYRTKPEVKEKMKEYHSRPEVKETKHQRLNNNIETKRYTCSKCDSAFCSNSDLRRHNNSKKHLTA